MTVTLTTLIKAEDLFNRLNPEEEQEHKRAEVIEDPVQKELVKGLERVLEVPYPVDHRYGKLSVGGSPIKKVYEMCLKHALADCSAGEIGNFVISLESYEDLLAKKKSSMGRIGRPNPEEKYSEQIGLYVSALINHSRDNEFNLFTRHIQGEIDNIGYLNNGKKITIEGSVGDYIGESMVDGEITVKGNVSDHLGLRMNGGKIKVNGIAKQRAGQWMRDGEIYVFGMAGAETGIEMGGGLIYIENGIWDPDGGLGSGMRGGRIHAASDIYGKRTGYFMRDGELRIDGNVHGNELCLGMKGGLICIEGDVKGTVGTYMSGGEIRVNGKYFPVSKTMTGGDIYRKGKLIVKNGEKVK